MALYRLSGTGVQRTTDFLCVPNDPLNRDWIDYLAWVALGGVPDPEFTPAQQAARMADSIDRAAAKADALVTALASKTPAEIDAYIVANVVDLASAKTVLRALAQVCGLLARGL